MEFHLLYKGPLKANGDSKDKHTLRKKFHKQLAVLWQHVPLKGNRWLLVDPAPPGTVSIIQHVGPYRFAPLVCEALSLVCELDILFLMCMPQLGRSPESLYLCVRCRTPLDIFDERK